MVAFGSLLGVVVQLVRIPACHAGGRGFEPRPLRQHIQITNISDLEKSPALCGAFFITFYHLS